MQKTLDIALCVVGATAYTITMGWLVLGVWPLAFYTLSRLWLAMSTGFPTPITTAPLALPLAGLAAYYSLASPTVSKCFAQLPAARPILVIGFVFYAGLTLTHFTVDALLDHGLTNRVAVFATGLGGFVLTRSFMSWLFNRIPAEMLAGFGRSPDK